MTNLLESIWLAQIVDRIKQGIIGLNERKGAQESCFVPSRSHPIAINVFTDFHSSYLSSGGYQLNFIRGICLFDHVLDSNYQFDPTF